MRAAGVLFISNDLSKIITGYQYQKNMSLKTIHTIYNQIFHSSADRGTLRRIRSASRSRHRKVIPNASCYVTFGGGVEDADGKDPLRTISRELLEELLFKIPQELDKDILGAFEDRFLKHKTLHEKERHWTFVICSYAELEQMLLFIKQHIHLIYTDENVGARAYTLKTLPQTVQQFINTPRNGQNDGSIEIGNIKEFDIRVIYNDPFQYRLTMPGFNPDTNALNPYLLSDVYYIRTYIFNL